MTPEEAEGAVETLRKERHLAGSQIFKAQRSTDPSYFVRIANPHLSIELYDESGVGIFTYWLYTVNIER